VWNPKGYANISWARVRLGWCRPVSAGVRAGSVMNIYGAEAWHAISDVIRVCLAASGCPTNSAAQTDLKRLAVVWTLAPLLVIRPSDIERSLIGRGTRDVTE
jgi:hypothetical protein